MNNNHNTTLLLPESQQQQQANKTQKKKCRGNRKKQRYRRQLYDQGLDPQRVDKLVEEKFPSQIQQQQEQQNSKQMTQEKFNTQNLQVYIPLDRVTLPPELNINQKINDDHTSKTTVKRKRFLLTPTPTTETTTILDKPFSQLSISQQGDRSKKTKTTTITTSNQCIDENNESSRNFTENFKPSYLKVPDRIFKQMLSNAIENSGSKIVQCLNTPDKLQFVRQISEITNNLYFKDLQRQLWQEYHNISLKDNHNWESKITNQYANQHNTCRMYKPQTSSIQQHQKTIQQQLERIKKQSAEYTVMLEKNTTQWQPSIDPNSLSHVINEYVKKGQQRLKENFDYKKEMISLDWNDHQLITKFYNLKPTDEQIELAKQIWQATADELRTREKLEILRQRIFLKRLPTKINEMVNDLLTDNQEALSDPSLEPEERTTFASHCSKAIIQCKITLMIEQMNTHEAVIRHHYATSTHLQDKLSKLNREKPHIYTILFMDTIEERRQAMIQRFFRIRKHKLKTFFDEAPTMNNNN